MDNNIKTLQTWDKLADQYQDKFMDMDLYNDGYDTFCDLVEKQYPDVFEIGCGPGNITKYILSKRPDFNILAIDTSPNMIRLAEYNNPSAGFRVMDCRKIDTLQQEFDAIICGFCMPYLSKDECIKLIKDCSLLLKNDGILYFSTIENDYEKSTFETSSDGQHTMFVYYHEEGYLQKALREIYFELVELTRKNFPKADGTTSSHMIFIARKITKS